MELLAPAGSIAALHAAVRGGADAVYVGLERFNARRGAENFTPETLREACRYAHVRGVSVYVALNTVALPEETEDALECARQAYRAGADAFIVQDVGLAHELHRVLPAAELHMSTQMNIHSQAGVELAASLGAKRVTLARELSVEEVSNLCAAAADLNMEVEVFAHGALCVCYSGQCLMSSMIGGRSANRGTCAQACRLPYELHVEGSGPAGKAPGEHLLSPKDLCTIDLLGQLHLAGVTSLKVEGRMKSPDYVFAVVSAYRAVLDRMAASDDGLARATAEERQSLSEAFSRGFTTAYLEGERGNTMMSYQRPNNRGVFLGRIAKMAEDFFVLETAEAPGVGDVLEIWTKKGRSTYEVSQVLPAKGKAVKLPFESGSRSMRGVHAGDRVFRVRCAQAAFEEVPYEPRVAVAGVAKVRKGKPLELSFSLAGPLRGINPQRAQAFQQVQGVATGPVVEEARTKALTVEDLRSHIDRMGQTPFSLASLDVHMDEGVGLGFSQVHQVRARALANLEDNLVGAFGAREVPKAKSRSWTPAQKEPVCQVAAFVTNPACARAARKAGAQLVYVSALNYKRGTATVQGKTVSQADQAGYPKQCVLALPAIEHDAIPFTREFETGFDVWEYVQPGKPVLVDSAASLMRALRDDCLCEVGPHVPVMNRLTLDVMAKLGVQRVWLSPELNLGQIKALAAGTPAALGCTIIGTQELMITEHCLLMSQGPCNQQCTTCNRRTRGHFLRDRKGFDFPVATDCMGRSHLYNSVLTDVAHAVPDLMAAGVSTFMVDATLMDAEQTAQAVGRAVQAVSLAQNGEGAVDKVHKATSGHLFRGVS
ncbi:MAG: U32 family peptidase [Coriobacteriia bacterium]|nr:U32 family peptidase [Coriobacteriia bacterium]